MNDEGEEEETQGVVFPVSSKRRTPAITTRQVEECGVVGGNVDA